MGAGARPGQRIQLQAPPDEHEEEEERREEPPLDVEANEDTCSSSLRLPHLGQAVSPASAALRISFSNWAPQSAHMNSYKGINSSCRLYVYVL